MQTITIRNAIALLLGITLSWSVLAAEAFNSRFIDIGHAQLNIVEWLPESGSGELILALPGNGGDYSRYKLVGPLLAEAGYHIVVINQRGIMGSTGHLDDLTLKDLADDVIAIADSFDVERFHMMGWAFGNRTSRMLATLYPQRVASLSLIAAGGLVPALTEPGELAELLSNPDLTQAEKIRLARRTLFSPAASDEIVLDYVDSLQYWPEGRRAQRQAGRNTPVELWAAGGTGPLLMVMGEDDLTAPVENGHIMKANQGERLTLVIIPEAGHTVGLEKPEATSAALVEFLKSHPL
ncbi:MAG: alpha/beta hydrolase [Pseudomonadales bacterium]|nr:alpha/beta hydrolase [Pseudomonadales bacterium]